MKPPHSHASRRLAPPLLVLFFAVFPALRLHAGQKIITQNGRTFLFAGPTQKPFDVTRHAIPLEEIQIATLSKDDIPALSSPKFLTAREAAARLKSSDRVLGVFWKGEAKAYPVRILNWHEIVNDSIRGQPILVSW